MKREKHPNFNKEKEKNISFKRKINKNQFKSNKTIEIMRTINNKVVLYCHNKDK